MLSNKSKNAQMHPLAWECIVSDLKAGYKDLLIDGNPGEIECPYGTAVRFDGKSDGLFLKDNPLHRVTCFTAEALINPEAGGPTEQRFLHIGDIHGDRLLLETRLTDDGYWYLDTYIQSGESQRTLIDPGFIHPIGSWYHVALTLDENGTMTNFINGKKEIEGKVDYRPINKGAMSIGARQNKVSWYKGSIYKIKISPVVLKPEDFISL